MSRIAALESPFEPEVAELLAAMMPAGAPPIGLFRTMVTNRAMTEAMHAFGSYELSRRLSVSLREREIVILRTCARCGAEYEWGVHVEVFGGRAGFSVEQIASLTGGGPPDPCWEPREQVLIRLVDALVLSRDLPDELWAALAPEFSDAQLLDLIALCGWYQAISLLCRALRVDLEPTAPRFAAFDAVTTGADAKGRRAP